MSKTLDAFLAKNPQALNETVLEAIQAYAENHTTSDDSNRLQEELLKLERSHVETNENAAPVFTECLIRLVPSLINREHILYWFQYFVPAAVDSAGHLNRFVKSARDFLLTVLAQRLGKDEVEVNSSKRTLQEYYKTNSLLYSRYILDIYLGQNLDKWFHIEEKSGIKQQERIRFINVNAKELLIQYGWKSTADFLAVLDEKFIEAKHRIHVLSLLSTFVSLQPPYLYQIRDSPLLESLMKALEYDLSSTALSISATTLAMILPHISTSLSPLVPRIFSLYGRLCCWRVETNDGSDRIDPLDPNGTEFKELTEDESSNEFNTWNKLGHIYALQDDKRNPTVTPLFTFLYGLFPVNFFEFIKNPSEYLTSKGFRYNGMDFWDDYEILVTSKPIMELHTLNPALFTITGEQELSDTARWQIFGTPTDIATQCLSFYNQASFRNQGPALPNFSVPFADEDDNESVSTKSTPLVGPPLTEPVTHAPKSIPMDESSNGILYFEEGERGSSSSKRDRHPRTLFSPSLSTIDTLLEEHTMLYSKKDGSDKRETDKRESITTMPENLGLQVGPLSAPPAAAPTTNLSSAISSSVSLVASTVMTPNIPPVSGGTREKELGRRRSTTLSSPGFIPHSQQSTKNASVTPLTVVIPSTDSSPVPNKRKDSKDVSDFDDMISKTENHHTRIIFLERELMLLKNELDFVSFIEQHSQYRFKKLKEQINESKINSEEVNHLLSNNKSLRKRIDILVKEGEKLQRSTKAFRSERHAYESTLMNKNRDYRNQLQESAKKLEELTSMIEVMNEEKNKQLQSIERQEKLISQYEMQLADTRESLKNAELRVLAFEARASKRTSIIASDGTTATRDCDCERDELPQKHAQYEDRIRHQKDKYYALKHEFVQQEKRYKEQILELEKLVSQYESKVETPLTRVPDMIAEFKQSSEEQYNQLKLAHEELSERYIALNHTFRKFVIDQEVKQAQIEAGIQQKRSLLGYDMNPTLSGRRGSTHTGTI